MESKGIDTLRQLGAKYWAPAISLLAFLPSAIDFLAKFTKGQNYLEPRLWWLFAGGLMVSMVIRFPRIAIFVTRLLLPRIEPELPETVIFRGPKAYGEKDAPEFYGRGAESATCWLDLKDAQFFVIDGQSGAGKSSFLSAEILPKARESFTVVFCRVPNDPFAAITAALGVISDSQANSADSTTMILTVGDSEVPVRTLPGKPLLVIIDQFDELFLTVEQAIRSRFFHTLKEMIAANKARVAICIRTDFLDLLLDECRSADATQEVLTLSRYYTLESFNPEQALGTLKLMLEPYHKHDPVRRQQLEDFASELVDELRRPKTDKRKPLDRGDIVLPVELQIVGFMAESKVGANGLRRDNLIRMGGKLELYRAYLENAKDYVWRVAGINGNDALLILRQLISPASTKYSQSVQEISARLNKPIVDVSRTLKCFSDKYLVRRIPTAGEGTPSERFELMHEHLTSVLKEAPEPYLQKLRDAEERLAFWGERTAHTQSDKAKPFKLLLWGAQFKPVPILEAISLWKYTQSPSDRALLRTSISSFLIRGGFYCALLSVLLSTSYWWWRSDPHQIALLIADAPYKEASAESPDWARSLALLGDCKAIEDVTGVTRGESEQSKLFSSTSETSFRSGKIDCGFELLILATQVPTAPWSDSFRSAITSSLTNASPEQYAKVLRSVRAMPASKSKALALSTIATMFARSGNNQLTTALFDEARIVVVAVTDQKERTESDLVIAEDQLKSNLAAGAKATSDDALSSIREATRAGQTVDADLRERWAAQRSNICCLDEALTVFKEAASSRSSWPPTSDGFGTVPVALARAGRNGDLDELGKSLFPSSFGFEELKAVLSGLIRAGFREQAVHVVNSLIIDKKKPRQSADRNKRLVQRLILFDALERKDVEQVKTSVSAVTALYVGLPRIRTFDGSPFGEDEDAREFEVPIKELVDLGLNSEAEELASSIGLEVGNDRSTMEGEVLVDLRSPMAEELIARGSIDRAIDIAKKVDQQAHVSASGDARLATIAARTLISESCDLYGLLAVSSIRSGRSVYIDEVNKCASVTSNSELADPFRVRFRGPLPDQFVEVLAALSASGQSERAVQLASGLSPSRKRRALMAIARSAARNGKVEYAASLAAASSDSAEVSRSLAAVFIAAADADHGDTVNLAQHRITYADDESQTLAAVARGDARKRRFRTAFSIAKRCSLAKDKLSAYTAIVTEYAKGQGKMPIE
jgi:hypothetical protein